MKDRFSNELEKQLRLAGWFPGRQTDTVIAQLDFSLHPEGENFLKEFGGLCIGGTILTHAYYINLVYQDRKSLGLPNLSTCLPVGASWFWCEGELWMDELGRVYQADDNQLAMVSESVEKALEILVIRKINIPPDFPKWSIEPRPPNPYDLGIRESLVMPIPKSRFETLFPWIITVIFIVFSIAAVSNLLSGEDIVATRVWSSLWFGLVIWQIWTCVRQGGIRKFAINYLGALEGKSFAKIATHDGAPTEIWFGFHYAGHQFVQRKVSLEKVESIGWGAGQATALTGRDKKDWQVYMWFKHDDPTKAKSFKPGQDVIVIGPSGRKEDTAIFGLSFVKFLGNAGVLLVPGKGDACFVRSSNNA